MRAMVLAEVTHDNEALDQEKGPQRCLVIFQTLLVVSSKDRSRSEQDFKSRKKDLEFHRLRSCVYRIKRVGINWMCV